MPIHNLPPEVDGREVMSRSRRSGASALWRKAAPLPTSHTRYSSRKMIRFDGNQRSYHKA